MIRIAPEPFDAPEPAALAGAQQAEMFERYGGDVEPGTKPTAADVTVFLVARDEDGAALGCGGLRRLDAETAELKRMYVVPAARGRGLGGRIVEALEAEALRLGCREVRLETGDRQPDARALYTRHGYVRIACWGAYAESPTSWCFARRLAPPGRPAQAG